MTIPASTIRRIIRETLGELSHAELLAVLLTYEEGMTEEEIAAVLGVRPGEAGTRKRAALRKIREAVNNAQLVHA